MMGRHLHATCGVKAMGLQPLDAGVEMQLHTAFGTGQLGQPVEKGGTRPRLRSAARVTRSST